MAEQVTFYVRMKAGRFVEIFGKDILVKDVAFRDQTIVLYGVRLRLVISAKTKAWKEPWYILTSDFESSTERIIKLYYHRFEIEESFKDVKHLRGLINIQVQKALSFKIIMGL
jgi:IS4 transposase